MKLRAVRDAEKVIIGSKKAIAKSQAFIDTMREELKRATGEAERRSITESMQEEALRIQNLTDLLEARSAELSSTMMR